MSSGPCSILVHSSACLAVLGSLAAAGTAWGRIILVAMTGSHPSESNVVKKAGGQNARSGTQSLSLLTAGFFFARQQGVRAILLNLAIVAFHCIGANLESVQENDDGPTFQKRTPYGQGINRRNRFSACTPSFPLPSRASQASSEASSLLQRSDTR